ncbi:MAG: biopolymer transporter ExbD [Gracilimonas sp.]|uniref:Biopolymer transporter ExbD n=1 Tax=Gracilimonas sediminicola TaxID=2952158 RepID=A0A9X2L2X3_9BACT|nr:MULTISPECIES: biopolymer transporter ExbD [Gracilimonas]MBO6584893.1 biopolymer transporter ExbD [Gracilimonas sp.]MBO6615836.1 biopolymer transporter ExbD [Gracilimonas sp.]MCP9291330.1 biopolymer transporter ExbD [Gracilimonas sediminicola]
MSRDFRRGDKKLPPLSLFSQSSLTDIVLLLLIFFLLTSSFVTNFGIRVEVPKAESSAATEAQFISVAVTKDGEFYVDGDLTARGSLATAIRNARNNKPQGTVVLRADKDAKVDDAVRVMNVSKALNLKIIMATEQGS